MSCYKDYFCYIIGLKLTAVFNVFKVYKIHVNRQFEIVWMPVIVANITAAEMLESNPIETNEEKCLVFYPFNQWNGTVDKKIPYPTFIIHLHPPTKQSRVYVMLVSKLWVCSTVITESFTQTQSPMNWLISVVTGQSSLHNEEVILLKLQKDRHVEEVKRIL